MISKSYLIENNKDFLLNNNFIMFYGENFGLKKELKSKIKKIYSGSSIVSLEQDIIIKDKNILINEISNLSLFTEKKIIFIENTSDKILDIIEEVVELKTNNKVILFAAVLDKKSKLRNYFEKSKDFQIVPCYADNEITLRKIISERLRGFKNLSTMNINLIFENSNSDRVKLYNELDKIILCFHDKILDTKKLESLLDANINEDFNILKDEAFLGNKNKTNKLLSDTNIDDEKSFYYLNLINQRLIKLKEIHETSKNSNVETAINSTKPPIFWKDKPNIIAQLRKWNQNKIKNILNITYEIETRIKSSFTGKKNILLKKLIIEICEKANA